MTKPKIIIDENLLREFVKNMPKAFNIIYDVYHKRVFIFNLKICKNHAEAEEVTQQVFIRLWEKRKYVDPTRPFDHFIYVLSRNCAFNHLKKKARRAEVNLESSEVSQWTSFATESDLYFAECERLTKKVVNALPQRRQLIYKMHFVRGYSHEKIAKIMDISPATVKSQLVKATKTIKDFILKCYFIFPLLFSFLFIGIS